MPLRLNSLSASSGLSGISPITICITRTALPITSAGCFSPRGPRGMRVESHDSNEVPSGRDFKLRHPAVWYNNEVIGIGDEWEASQKDRESFE